MQGVGGERVAVDVSSRIPILAFPRGKYEKRLTCDHSILRPGFFMDNFDNFIGSIIAAVMKKGLNEDTTLGMIVSRIG